MIDFSHLPDIINAVLAMTAFWFLLMTAGILLPVLVILGFVYGFHGIYRLIKNQKD